MSQIRYQINLKLQVASPYGFAFHAMALRFPLVAEKIQIGPAIVMQLSRYGQIPPNNVPGIPEVSVWSELRGKLR